MKRADNIAATDSATNYAVSTVSLVHVYYIRLLYRGQLQITCVPVFSADLTLSSYLITYFYDF